MLKISMLQERPLRQIDAILDLFVVEMIKAGKAERASPEAWINSNPATRGLRAARAITAETNVWFVEHESDAFDGRDVVLSQPSLTNNGFLAPTFPPPVSSPTRHPLSLML
jgi:hypothetical protein